MSVPFGPYNAAQLWPWLCIGAEVRASQKVQSAAVVFLLRDFRLKESPTEGCRISQSKRARRNDEITTSRVRVIGAEGEQVGILSIEDALESASSKGLDLVEVAPNSDPPVCRIMDYGKFVFEQSKKAQSAKRKQKQIHVKEVKFRPGTEEGDYQVPDKVSDPGRQDQGNTPLPWPGNGAQGVRIGASEASPVGSRRNWDG